jgi:hypothetical protein
MTSVLRVLNTREEPPPDIEGMSKSRKLVPTAWGERRYVLFDGNEEVGRLEFEGALSTRARVTADKVEWTFERVGASLLVRLPSEDAEVLAAKMTVVGGVAVTLEGRTWRWMSTRIRRGQLGWVRDDEQVAIRYEPKLKDFRIEQHIEIATTALPVETERLLLFLGAYLAVQTYTDVAALTAAVMAANVVS